MSQLPLFYIPELVNVGVLEISGDTAHHIGSVLRMKSGEELRLSDGAGNFADAVIVEVNKKFVSARVENISHQSVTNPRLCVVQAIPKSDRLKETLELLVEVGVNEIIPWAAKRSIGKFPEDGELKWSNAIRTAGIQARRVNIPTLHPVKKLSEIIQLVGPNDHIFICHESAQEKISKCVSGIKNFADASRIFVIIGPEGGVSEEEIETFSALPQSHLVSLGEIVFRSAHAGIAAFSALQMALGRW